MKNSHDDATGYNEDLNDEQLEKLLTSPDDDPIFDPPADLLDQLKADIPADPSFVLAPMLVDVGNTKTHVDDAGASGEIVTFEPAWYRRQPLLALAATLVMAAGLMFLARRVVLPSQASMSEQSIGLESRAKARDVAEQKSQNDAVERNHAAGKNDAAGRVDQSAPAARRIPMPDPAPAEVAEQETVPQEKKPSRFRATNPVTRGEDRLEAQAERQETLLSAGLRESVSKRKQDDADARIVGSYENLEVDSIEMPIPAPVIAPSEARPAAKPQAASPKEVPKPEARRAWKKAMVKDAATTVMGGQARDGGSVANNEVAKPQAARQSQGDLTLFQDQITVTTESPVISKSSITGSATYSELPPVAFTDASQDNQSTFGLDVDTASYGVVRAHLQDGHMPPPSEVRVEGMVNYFDYGDKPPRGSADFALTAEGSPVGTLRYQMRVNVKAREVANSDRPPSLLTFVVDVSGSMRQGDKLEMVKRSLEVLVDELGDGDRLALVTYGSEARVVLPPTRDHHAVRRAIGSLSAGGSTNAEAGLRLAYQITANAPRRSGEIRRVILCSDGVANVGLTSGEEILDQVRRYAEQGVELTTIGVGMGTYNDELLETLANRGNGRYAYVDTENEARRIFAEQLTGTLMTIAAEARAQVTFNHQVVSKYRLLGYENRDIPDERFRDDTVDAGEIGAGHQVTALYEIETFEPLSSRDHVAVAELRYASIARQKMREDRLEIRGKDLQQPFDHASRAYRLSALVAELAEHLRGSRRTNLDDLFRRTQRAAVDYPGNVEVAELVSLVGLAAKIEARQP